MAVAAPYTEYTDEQKAITEMVRQFADEQILPNAEHYDHEDEFPDPIVEQMKELGLFGVTIPEEYGGMGLDLTTYAMIIEELSRGWISISGVVNTHFIGSYLLMKFGSDEQRERLLPRMATGEIRAAFSLSGMESIMVRAGVFGRPEYLKPNTQSYSTSARRSIVWIKSSAVSPGKPTMMSVESEIGRRAALIQEIRSRYHSGVYSLAIILRTRVDPDCTGRCT